MKLLTEALRAALVANAAASLAAEAREARYDPVPVLKLFNPIGAATWLATELYDDGDTLFGLADLGFGCPELGTFSLAEIAAVRLPFGLGIERDLAFSTTVALSVWADTARRAGSIPMAQQHLDRAAPDRAANDLSAD
ncbi:hypothetical protein FHS95_001902 [Sphingomonas naasensis]|uniref:DUF2958 domain-containing protein n=1 Tax=Sphingomonas naasensis TaxID=1344951 RepID=A0A4S1WM53_9SPHN|nr:DUF2958 domain-containing protein [Sphingomonas naasensis]NIJ20210.1 hypothetical protein [Sphingomonas naasensis]TGX44354.1 DUF2958 domain-containing protein [Sphingomonas naasensis]